MTARKKMQERDTILIIEDNPEDLLTIKRIIGKIAPGLKIVNAASLAEAIETIEASLSSLRFICLDLNLPDSYGASSVIQLCRHTGKCPVVVTTGMAHRLSVQESEKAGAIAVFFKADLQGKKFKDCISGIAADAAVRH